MQGYCFVKARMAMLTKMACVHGSGVQISQPGVCKNLLFTNSKFQCTDWRGLWSLHLYTSQKKHQNGCKMKEKTARSTYLFRVFVLFLAQFSKFQAQPTSTPKFNQKTPPTKRGLLHWISSMHRNWKK
jgi:hypothetical protein